MAKVADRVQIAANIAQALAIILGVGFSVNELVLKDRDAERQFVELTITQVDRGQSEPVVAARRRLYELTDEASRTLAADDADPAMRMRIGKVFDDETRPLSHFYNVITRCFESGVCDRRIVLALTCDDANRDADTIDELQWRVGNRFLAPTFLGGLARLRRECGGAERRQQSVESGVTWDSLPPSSK